MAEKLLEDVDELFSQKSMWTSMTKTVGVEIPEFLKKIEEKKLVESLEFKISEVEFFIRVTPGYQDSEFIRVDLMNCSKEKQATSVTFLQGSGAAVSWEMIEVPGDKGRGCPRFLSHEKFKAWANIHGDVFQLKAKVTLHQKKQETGDDWIRYRVSFLLCLGVNISVQERAKSGGAEVSGKRGHHPCPHQGHHAGRRHRGFHHPLRD